MRLYVDTARVTFTVTKNPEPKNDQDGKQKHRKDDGAPMWVTQVMALDEETGGEVLQVTVAGVKPSVSVGQTVVPVTLEAIPWATNGRHGVAYRAAELSPVNAK